MLRLFVSVLCLCCLMPLRAEDLVLDTAEPEIPCFTVDAELSPAELRQIDHYLEFVRMFSDGSVGAADLPALFDLLEKDPWSQELAGITFMVAGWESKDKDFSSKRFLEIADKTDSPFVTAVAAMLCYMERDWKPYRKYAGKTLAALTNLPLAAGELAEDDTMQKVLRTHFIDSLACGYTAAIVLEDESLSALLRRAEEKYPELARMADCRAERSLKLAEELAHRAKVPENFYQSDPIRIKLLSALMLSLEEYLVAVRELPPGAGGLEHHAPVANILIAIGRSDDFLFALQRAALLGNGDRNGQLKLLAYLYRRRAQLPESTRAMAAYLLSTEKFSEEDMITFYLTMFRARMQEYGLRVYADMLRRCSGSAARDLVLQYTAHLLQEMNASDAALQKIRGIVSAEKRFTMELGLLLRLKRNPEALAAAKLCVRLYQEKGGTLPASLGDLCFYAAGVNDDIAFAESFYPALLKRNPENAILHNNLGYFYLERDLKPELAEKLILRAYKLDSSSVEIMDSVAFLWYKQKKYAAAKAMILKALKNGDDPEILIHAGDIHFALGELTVAENFWHQALRLTSDKKEQAQILQKLAESGKLRKQPKTETDKK